MLLGQIAAARRQIQQAALSYRNAIRVQTALAARGEEPDPEPWKLLAQLYLETGDEEARSGRSRNWPRAMPRDGSGFRELGRTLLERREPGRAERHLRRAVQLDPRDVDALRLLARAHEALRREPDARDDLLGILRIDPDDEPALLALGGWRSGRATPRARRSGSTATSGPRRIAPTPTCVWCSSGWR